MKHKKESSIFKRLLSMATAAGAFAAISAPAHAGPIGFAANLDSKLAPMAASIASPVSSDGAQASFAELIFVRMYSRVKAPFAQAMSASPREAAPFERPSAVETFDSISRLA